MLLELLLISTPDWIDHVPESAEYVYFVGESSQLSDKEDSLQKAWYSALHRIGMAEFPDLTELSSKSIETIRSSDFQREATEHFQFINWKGLSEDKRSPFIHFDIKEKVFQVYRLLKWKKIDLADAQREASIAAFNLRRGKVKPAVYTIPDSPEIVAQKEDKRIEALMQLKKINALSHEREDFILSIFHHVKCGIKISDLISLIGEPDSIYAACEYHWAQFMVFSCDGFVRKIGSVDICKS